MMLVTKEFRAEIAHRLMEHPGLCYNIHGHSYVFEITLEGERDEKTNMVLDFKELKEEIEDAIGHWDHALMLFQDDPLAQILPADVCRLILTDGHPTAEWMAEEIARRLQEECGLMGQVASVKVWETKTSCAEWRRDCCHA